VPGSDTNLILTVLDADGRWILLRAGARVRSVAEATRRAREARIAELDLTKRGGNLDWAATRVAVLEGRFEIGDYRGHLLSGSHLMVARPDERVVPFEYELP
jgi:hypothetical protein